MKITNADWFKEKDELYLKVKTKNGYYKIKPKIKPYFFIKKDDVDKLKNLNTKINYQIETGDYKSLEGEEVIKIICNFPSEVRELRNSLNIKTFEADIPFVNRWIIDENVEIEDNPRIIFFDVEADARKGFPRVEKPDQRILSISLKELDGKEYFICDDDENKIYDEFNKFLIYYDLFVGYNSNRWDLPYLQERARTLGINFAWKEANFLDLILLLKRSYRGRISLRLDDIAQRELGETKLFSIYDMGGADFLWNLFEKDRETLKKYNIQDVRLLEKLEKKMGLLKAAIYTAIISKNLYSDVELTNKVIDNMLLIKAFNEQPRIILKTKKELNLEGKDISIPGALVELYEKGYFKNCLSFDFTSMYPRIIESFNIGIETMNDNGEIISGYKRFNKNLRSLLAKFLEDLDRKRVEVRQKMEKLEKYSDEWNVLNTQQLSYKLILNASYGIFIYKYFRYFNPDIAKSITLTGQSILKDLMEILRKMNFNIIYCDTDGVFCYSKNEKILKYLDLIVNEVNEALKNRIIEKYNVPKEYYNINVKLENIFFKFFIGTKKKYIGLVTNPLDWITGKYLGTSKYERGNKLVVGLELKRSGTPGVVALTQENIINFLFTSESFDEVKVKTINFFKKLRKLIFEDKIPTELIMSKAMTKEYWEYKVKNIPHVKAGYKLNDKLRPGDDVYYVVKDIKNGQETEPIYFGSKFPKISEKAKKYYFDLALSHAERILGEKINIFDLNLGDFL